MRTSILAASLFFTANVGAAVEVTPYIVNGIDIIEVSSEFPSFVSLFYDRIDYDGVYGLRPFCGATLLSDQFILTAAHCVYGDRDSQLFMSVVPQLQNENDFPYSALQRVMVEEYYYPDTYNDDTLFDDIAVLKLVSPITAVTSYAVFADSNFDDYRKASEEFFAVGHGNTQSNQDNSQEVQKTQLSYVPNAYCDIYGTSTSKNLCMTGADTSASNSIYDNATCQGDSGGPLYWQGKQVGITSFGPRTCGNPNVTPNSVFTEVSQYEDWIRSVMNGNETPKVVVTDSERYAHLEQQASAVAVSGNTSASGSQSSGGGGSLGFAMLSLLGILSFMRRPIK
ncbi:S1 family peptidase [Vibrio japonicus]|uniref:Trypsin-like serine protease n=1 Tax=Vibrio japonicus TaxID=1824638 RepID=A0ABY5LTC7_9VIBR|nr:trypsin-like serine protease [Vibrio japonicus]UUM33020.1 trypsin-like serine protease [Vibrio japonicus]